MEFHAIVDLHLSSHGINGSTGAAVAGIVDLGSALFSSAAGAAALQFRTAAKRRNKMRNMCADSKSAIANGQEQTNARRAAIIFLSQRRGLRKHQNREC